VKGGTKAAIKSARHWLLIRNADRSAYFAARPAAPLFGEQSKLVAARKPAEQKLRRQ